MSRSSKFARISVVLFSLTLLAGYVWHSQVTPNTPPPDPLGLNAVELELRPEVVDPVPSGERPTNDLRIIGSKSVNQPVFSVRKITWEFGPDAETGDPPKHVLRPYIPSPEERVGTWLPGFEMTGLSIDPLRKPDEP